MDIEKLIERLRKHRVIYKTNYDEFSGGACTADCVDAADIISTLQAENERLRKELEYEREHANAYHEECGQWEAENEKLRAELEQVTLENNALWTYIEIVDREYRRYMDRGYIDRLDELRRTWKRGQKED